MSLRYCTVCGSIAEIVASVCSGCGADLPKRSRKFAQEGWSSKPLPSGASDAKHSDDTVGALPSNRPRKKTMLGIPLDPSLAVAEEPVQSQPPGPTESARPPLKRERKATMLGIPSLELEATSAGAAASTPPVSPAPDRPKRSAKGTMFGMAPQRPSDPPPVTSRSNPGFREIPETDEPAAPLALGAPDPLPPRPSYRARVNVRYEEGYSAPVRPLPWYRTFRGKLTIVGAIALLIVALVELFG